MNSFTSVYYALKGMKVLEICLTSTSRYTVIHERVMGIEPTLEAWEASVLPLNYTR